MAPAGDEEALRAAIRSGADAVYFGVQDWNARVRARNFSLEGIEETIASIHRDGVRAYVTFNTLVFGPEERAAHLALERLHAARPDALIVQDLGIARWIHERFPSLPLHASTQMTISNAGAIAFLRRFGVERVILARELTLAEIGRIRTEVGGTMELEVFVHGALCVSYSGQCLSSEAWGGRSANRGQCAQACRLPYDLIVDGAPRDLGDRAYLLSPRDLEAYRRIPELIALGIEGLKIEGRMKSAAYVAAATALYRQALDRAWPGQDAAAPESAAAPENAADLEDRAAEARKVFSRGPSEGFLGGVNHQVLVDGRTRAHRGVRIGVLRAAGPGFAEMDLDPQARCPVPGDGLLFASGPHESQETGGKVHAVHTVAEGRLRLIFGPEGNLDTRIIEKGCPVFITHDRRLDVDLRRRMHDPSLAKRIPLAIEVRGIAGTPLTATYRDEQGRETRVASDSPLRAADRHGLDEAAIRSHLGRLGGTRYSLEAVDLTLAEPLAIPVHEMNAMRRAAIDEMDRLRGGPLPRSERVEAPGGIRSMEDAPSPVSDAVFRADGIEGVRMGSEPASAAKREDPFVVLCRTREQVEAACGAGAGRIALDFLDLVGLKKAIEIVRVAGAELTLCPPRIEKPGEEKLDGFLLRSRPDAILVRSLGMLERLAKMASQRDPQMAPQLAPQRPDPPILIADSTLNAVNRAAISILIEAGCARVSPGLDLDNDQLLDLLSSGSPDAIEIPLHHHLPLFHTEHCVFAAFLSRGADWRTCGRPCDRHRIRLRDRTGQEHAVIADVGCRNTVFGAQAQSVLGLLPRLRQAGCRHFRLEMLEEDAEQTRHLIEVYREAWDGAIRPADAIRTLQASARFGISGASPEPSRRPDWKPQGGRRPQIAGGPGKGRPSAARESEARSKQRPRASGDRNDAGSMQRPRATGDTSDARRKGRARMSRERRISKPSPSERPISGPRRTMPPRQHPRSTRRTG